MFHPLHDARYLNVNRFRIPLIPLFCLATLYAAAAPPPGDEARWSISLNGDWRFQLVEAPTDSDAFAQPGYDDSSWNAIAAPSDWELTGAEPPAWGDAPSGVGLYRKEVTVPANWQDRRVFLRIERVSELYALWIDGQRIGGDWAGDLPQTFELTDRLTSGAHLAAMKVWREKDAQRPGWRLGGIDGAVTLYSTPRLAIDRVSIQTSRGGVSSFSVSVDAYFDLPGDEDGCSVSLSLKNPSGDRAASLDNRALSPSNGSAFLHHEFTIDNPVPWNAESPALYTLTVELSQRGQVIHRVQRDFGLIDYQTDGASIFCDGTPIEIRGVNYTPFDGERGYALGAREFSRDAALMKEMNLNAVCVTGRAPSDEFLSLCDRAGLYVALAPPPDRFAEYVSAFSRHPSLFLWIVDPESLTGSAGASWMGGHREALAGRLLAAPLSSGEAFPDHVDVLGVIDPPLPEWRRLLSAPRPVLGLNLMPAAADCMEGAADFWALARAGADLSGGFLQQFADLCTDSGAFQRDWPPAESTDSTAMRRRAFGHDGLLDLNRAPQTDSYEVRRALSPVQIAESEADWRPGRSIELTLRNEYDFTNLRDLECRWSLAENGRSIEQGDMLVDLPPRQSMQLAVRPTFNKPDPNAEYHAALQFLREGRVIYEHTVWLKPDDWRKNFIMRLSDLRWDPAWKVTTNSEETLVEHRDFIFHASLTNAAWFLFAREGNTRLIADGPQIRVGRSLTPPEAAFAEGSAQSGPRLLSVLQPLNRNVDRRVKDIEIKTLVVASAPESATRALPAQIDVLTSPWGYLDVRCILQPGDEWDSCSEAGLSFTVPPTLNRAGWLGEGPYPSYPGKDHLNLHSFFPLTPIDRLTEGNRANVQLLALMGEHGYGLGIVTWRGNIGWESAPEGTRVFINAAVAGKGTGSYPTRYPAPLKDLPEDARAVVFRLVPLIKDHIPTLFEAVVSQNE